MDFDFLPQNTPTVSDTPFAVGGKHRNDFGSAERVCVMLTSGACLDVNPTDEKPKPRYEECRLRCWGSNMNTFPKAKVRFNDTYSNYHPLYSVWEYPKGTQDPTGDPDDLKYQPQVTQHAILYSPAYAWLITVAAFVLIIKMRGVLALGLCREKHIQSPAPGREAGKTDQWKKPPSIAPTVWLSTRTAIFMSQTHTTT